jgi:DNA-binding CsgD family transcriptional regulator
MSEHHAISSNAASAAHQPLVNPAAPALDRRRTAHAWPLLELLPQPLLLICPQRRLLAGNSHARRLISDGRIQLRDGQLTVLAQLASLQLCQLVAQATQAGGSNIGIWFERDMTTGWLHVTTTTPLAAMLAGTVYREALLLTLHLDQPALTQAARIDALAMCFRLSATERYVLMLLSDGLVVEAVARQLGLQVSTVRSHVRNLLGKTQAPSLMQLLRWTGSAASLPH